MRLNHVNLSGDDLDEAQDLFRRVFDFRLLDRKGDAVAIMTDGHGFTLVLSDQLAFGGQTPTRYPDSFHVGFILGTPEEVDRAHDRLVVADIRIGHEPRKMRDSYGFYFTALGDILFEVSCPI